MDDSRLDFPRAARLLRRADYEAVYRARHRRSSPQFAVFFRANAGVTGSQAAASNPVSRFGISVKKALGGSVVRNRIRRRVREILRRNRAEIPAGWDIVIHPRPSVETAPYVPLEAELVRLLRGLLPVPVATSSRERSTA